MGQDNATINENEFFRQATLQILSCLNAEEAMKRCLDFLKQYIPVSGMYFGIYDPALNIGKILASIWPEGMQHPGEIISVPRKFWQWMKEQKRDEPEIFVINDIEKEEFNLQQLMSLIFPPDMSCINMDLELENERLGGIFLFVEGKNKYTEDHINLISLLHEPFAVAISNILQHQEIRRLKDMLADDNVYLNNELRKKTGDTIIGEDFGLKGIMEMVYQVSPLESPVLLMGETGVGKELIANAIHSSSNRRKGPYITVNCGAIPDNLIDSELFGHEKGAFTGAISRKRGRFERAHKGTIFLDEIGDLPIAAQTRLLRVLQAHEIERVGGTETIPVDVRIISATHRNLEEMVSTGEFREDLWFRLNVFPIVIPPLRQRIDDIPALVFHFIERKSKELKIRNTLSLAPEVIERLQAYNWPGNIRELENIIERELILNQINGNGNLLKFETFPKTNIPQNHHTPGNYNKVILPLDEVTTNHIKKALEHSKGRIEGEKGAAQILGLHPSTLRGKIRKLGIS